MPKEITVSISTMIAVLVAVFGGMGWLGEKFEEQVIAMNNMQALVMGRIADIDIANARQDARLDLHAERLELVNVRQSWLYQKSRGVDVPPGWPQVEDVRK